ncbi:LysR substrate-binding domain-containing protein [Streptomyces sp. NPDC050095]|uniref:LysR substrate-binding domain-containing protein n=1 Tax=unclassified Streptomyces TaxID=2593676 RepID=UPI00341423BC
MATRACLGRGQADGRGLRRGVRDAGDGRVVHRGGRHSGERLRHQQALGEGGVGEAERRRRQVPDDVDARHGRFQAVPVRGRHESPLVRRQARSGEIQAVRDGQGRTSVRLAEFADRTWIRCAMEPVVHGQRFLGWACGEAGFSPRTAVFTEHTSTAVRMAAAGVGVCAAPAHIVTGAVGEDCVVLSVEPPWRRSPTVLSRVERVGAAAAFVELLRRSGPYGASPSSPVRPYEGCAPEPAVVR